MRVAEAVGRVVAGAGPRHAFGVVGSGNFAVTNALTAAGVRFVAARHEGGAATMADAYARLSGEVGVVTLHQGCGLTNALTGVTEAAKSRTPLLVLAAETRAPRSNFAVDQDALATAVGAVPCRVRSPETAVADTAEALRTAVTGRRTVVLNLPLDVQAASLPTELVVPGPPGPPPRPAPSRADAAALAELMAGAARPVFVAGRGAAHAREALEALADRCGALLATSAVARGLFTGSPWSLGVSGGFSSPLAAELIAGADLVVGWGCALNMWTMRHGRLVGEGARVAQVDLDADALGAHRAVDVGVVGDVAETARAVLPLVEAAPGQRTPELAARIAREVRWRDVPYADEGDGQTIDPRTLSTALDDLLPAERVLAVDSGNFMGWPTAYLSVPDGRSTAFTQAFQSVGLGLASAVGAALARPDLLPVAAVGDGGLLMSASELDTVRRLGLPMVVVVYDDEAYGAEVHHFGPDGDDLSTVRFPPTDLAAVGRGHGFDAVVVRRREDLAQVAAWVAGPRDRPLLVDAKVTSSPAWWLEEAFRGH